MIYKIYHLALKTTMRLCCVLRFYVLVRFVLLLPIAENFDFVRRSIRFNKSADNLFERNGSCA